MHYARSAARDLLHCCQSIDSAWHAHPLVRTPIHSGRLNIDCTLNNASNPPCREQSRPSLRERPSPLSLPRSAWKRHFCRSAARLPSIRERPSFPQSAERCRPKGRPSPRESAARNSIVAFRSAKGCLEFAQNEDPHQSGAERAPTVRLSPFAPRKDVLNSRRTTIFTNPAPGAFQRSDCRLSLRERMS